ncbi:hypothetical protein BO99DRAFT_17037 [Aspergillus violaceofuscus CBS 115571]|uniref:Uncharacterized protein n=1 Tax=Aspergillus violaceofuscus (strain CBS 115571) TaxID=1450538 RepID=A0A2V5GT98_ASPV1|nr:hypothetical protein BO99DRAFT_17037 [Aspergillus violaceofuscus CBS 115571]
MTKHVQSPRIHIPVNYTTEDLKLRLSSNFGLYAGLDEYTVSGGGGGGGGVVEVALYQSFEPHLASIRLRRTKRINSKMVDIYVNSGLEREYLIQYAEKWVPFVKEHQYGSFPLPSSHQRPHRDNFFEFQTLNSSILAQHSSWSSVSRGDRFRMEFSYLN